MKLMPHQNATRSLSELYVWHLESIYQEGVELNYIPRLTDESKTLYEAYQEQYRCNPLSDGTIDAGHKLIELMAMGARLPFLARGMEYLTAHYNDSVTSCQIP